MPNGAESAEKVASFFSWTTVVVASIVLVVLLVAAGVVFYLRYRKKSPAQAAAKPATTAKGELAELWKAFLAKLPEAARDYPVYVVLGEAGAGKSTLIESRVDWKGQAAQFLPSDGKNPQMQLYVGPDVLVQEISAPLLHDTSDEAKAALTELWELLGAQRPTVIAVLDATELVRGPPDAVKELAQLVRGKVNLLASVRSSAIRARLCLTHFDEIAGYTQVVSALGARAATQPLPIGDDTSGAGLARCLDPFEASLSHSLTSQPILDFQASVRFFGKARAVFDALSPFVRALAAPDDLSTAPAVGPLYLSALAPADAVGDPFTINRSLLAADVKRAENNVRTWCLAALVFAGVVTAGLYTYQGYELSQARKAVQGFVYYADGYPAQTSTARLGEAERAAGERLDRLAQAERLPLFRRSFTTDKQEIRKAFSNTLRTAYLLPLLDGRLDQTRLAYAVGLIYATPDNSLGELVKQDPKLWAGMLGVPDSVPLDYVKASTEVYPAVVQARPSTTQTTPSAATDIAPWYSYLSRLAGAFKSEDISAHELESLQQDAGPLVLVLRQAQSFATTKSIVDILAGGGIPPGDEHLDIKGMFGSVGTDTTTPTWVAQNSDTLSSLLTLVLTSRLPEVQVAGLSLQQVLALLVPLPPPPLPPAPASASASAAPSTSASAAPAVAPSASAPATVPPPPTYVLVLSGTTFVFSSSAWSDLLTRSRMSQIVVDFIKGNTPPIRFPFFSGDPPTYLPVGASTASDKGPTGTIPGIFTLAAFEAEVKPVLLGFDQTLAGKALGASRKRELTDYVRQESERYAGAYAAALKTYYQSYQHSSASCEALAFDIGQLALPGSWLASFLSSVATNADLPITAGNPYLQPLVTNLAAYKPVIAASDQLGKYTAILGKMLPPAAAAPPPGQPPVLADRISPCGAAALAMVKKDPTSALLQVQPWLASVGLGDEWSSPFLKPITSAYNLGVANLAQVVGEAWKKDVAPDVQTILTQFPFAARATVEVSPADLEARVGVNGQFWSDFDRLISPVCRMDGGAYAPLSSAITLPAGMLATVNALSRTKAALWDKDGKVQALALSIQALPFPAPKAGDPAITLSQLQTGEVSVFGFNQTPAWQALPLAWSKQGTSSINVQVSAPSGTHKQTQSTPPATSTWSFYRLLLQAGAPAQLVWTWHLPTDATGKQTSPVSFALGSDPWAPFTVPPP